MKQNNKGFTLVELLAVIVILAIIALIATPIILGVIDTARKGAAKNSAYGYIDAVEKSVLQDAVDKGDITVLDGEYTINAGGTTITPKTAEGATATDIPVSFKGDAPKSGTLMYDSGKLITGTTITVGNYTFKTTDSSGTLVDGDASSGSDTTE